MSLNVEDAYCDRAGYLGVVCHDDDRSPIHPIPLYSSLIVSCCPKAQRSRKNPMRKMGTSLSGKENLSSDSPSLSVLYALAQPLDGFLALSEPPVGIQLAWLNVCGPFWRCIPFFVYVVDHLFCSMIETFLYYDVSFFWSILHL